MNLSLRLMIACLVSVASSAASAVEFYRNGAMMVAVGDLWTVEFKLDGKTWKVKGDEPSSTVKKAILSATDSSSLRDAAAKMALSKNLRKSGIIRVGIDLRESRYFFVQSPSYGSGLLVLVKDGDTWVVDKKQSMVEQVYGGLTEAEFQVRLSEMAGGQIGEGWTGLGNWAKNGVTRGYALLGKDREVAWVMIIRSPQGQIPSLPSDEENLLWTAIGGIALLFALGGIGFVLYKHRRSSRTPKEPQKAEKPRPSEPEPIRTSRELDLARSQVTALQERLSLEESMRWNLDYQVFGLKRENQELTRRQGATDKEMGQLRMDLDFAEKQLGDFDELSRELGRELVEIEKLLKDVRPTADVEQP